MTKIENFAAGLVKKQVRVVGIGVTKDSFIYLNKTYFADGQVTDLIVNTNGTTSSDNEAKLIPVIFCFKEFAERLEWAEIDHRFVRISAEHVKDWDIRCDVYQLQIEEDHVSADQAHLGFDTDERQGFTDVFNEFTEHSAVLINQRFFHEYMKMVKDDFEIDDSKAQPYYRNMSEWIMIQHKACQGDDEGQMIFIKSDVPMSEANFVNDEED
jgi:hypothetical protein